MPPLPQHQGQQTHLGRQLPECLRGTAADGGTCRLRLQIRFFLSRLSPSSVRARLNTPCALLFLGGFLWLKLKHPFILSQEIVLFPGNFLEIGRVIL